MRGWMISVMILASPAVAADQFDLVCKGGTRAGFSARMIPTQIVYHVDLQRGKWCTDECSSVFDLAKVDENAITFIDVEEKYKGDFWEQDRVFRSSGVWTHLRSGTSAGLEIQGQCEPAAFTGIKEPAKKF